MEIKTHYRNHLPHIAPLGGTFFITFRLADSLPAKVVQKMNKDYEAKITNLKNESPANLQIRLNRLKKSFILKYDKLLDQSSYGECHLKIDQVARVVKQKLHQYDGKYYHLQAYCIMPNHVHCVIDNYAQLTNASALKSDYTQLYDIMKLVKGGTAYECNRLLKRKGKFWQKDSFDHYIRNHRSNIKLLRYIINNPVKAGLVEHWEDFDHTYLAKEYYPLLEV